MTLREEKLAGERASRANALTQAQDREAATREILQVISQSRSDYAPVFDVVLANAARLCKAPIAMLLLVNDAQTHFALAASFGEPLRSTRLGDEWPLDSRYGISRTILQARTIHLEDMAESDLYRGGDPVSVRLVDEEGLRTRLSVPLVRGDVALGCIALFRRETKPFADADIALVETFAAQAVIAVDNVRQFRELQTRLEREAETREILEIISQSRDDKQPVFEAILESASRLCNAPLAFLSIADEARTHVTIPAYRGVRPNLAAALRECNEPLEGSQLIAVKSVADGQVIRSANLLEDERLLSQSQLRTELVNVEGARSILAVPLLNEGQGIGAIILYRREVSPFTDDEVSLVQGFAAQAVIAIENVKQFRALQNRTEELRAKADELKALNSELEHRVEAQVGELERMGRLKRFLSPQVADAVVSSGNDKMLQSHRALLGILFCDIRGFTAFCETAEPEETIEILQTYHQEMGRLIAQHGAGIDHRSGDGIMVLFNDPLPCDDPASDALRLALAMRERMEELSKGWKRLGHRLGFGIGIALGYATVGMVGWEGRFEYTASGTAVNLASRLCDMAEDGEILLSPRAYAAVEEDIAAESVGELSLKGMHAAVEVFRVARPASEQT